MKKKIIPFKGNPSWQVLFILTLLSAAAGIFFPASLDSVHPVLRFPGFYALWGAVLAQFFFNAVPFLTKKWGPRPEADR